MSIPASQITNVIPGVVSGGGNSLAMNGLFLTQSPLMPTATVYAFVTSSAVSNFFGPSSAEAALAAIYFAGHKTSTVKPAAMLFAAYNVAARAAFLQSGSLATMTLAGLQALSGTLTITVDGTSETSSAINLNTASSFSNAAALIQAAFASPGFAVEWSPVASAFVFTTAQTGAAATISLATGSLAAALNLGQSSGAFLSQGAVADSPGSAMDNAVAISQNFATFVTLWEPDLAGKEAFAVWSGEQDDRYLYIAWDSDPNASVQGNESCFGAVAAAASYNGVTAVSGDPAAAYAANTTLAAMTLNVAAFMAGAVASINFAAKNGRTSLAFLASASAAVLPTCTSLTTANNLKANGYNYYGSYATANQGFTFLYNGQMFGPFVSIVRYINQIYLNSQFQLALLILEMQAGSIAYNPQGYGLIRNVLMDPINAALAFGAIRAGVTLSSAQTAEVNQAAGVNAASVIQTQGFYLQILDPGTEARAAGQTPIINFWYTDGGDVLQISLASIDIL